MNDIWPSYVINLADNTTRMETVRAQLDAQGIPFERVEAVWGADLPPEEVARVYDAGANKRRAKQDLVPGELGCYLSHIAAWRRIAEGTAPGGIILEDDFAASSDLAEVLHALCVTPSPEWDIAKLFCIDDAPQMISAAPLAGRYQLCKPYRVPSTTLGYAITRASAAALLARSVPFFRPIDEDHKFFWEHGQRIALVHPNVLTVGTQDAATGTIGSERRGRSKGAAWRKLRYQLGYQLRLRLHRLKGTS